MALPRKLLPGLAGAAGAAVLLAPTLWYPFGRDQSVFAFVGSVIARGGMPYRDAWDIKPPGIYLLYALLARLSGADGWRLMHLVRIADLLIAALTGALLVLLARSLRLGTGAVTGTDSGGTFGELPLGPIAALWYTATYLQGGFWGLAQAETWANPMALGAALLLLQAARGHQVIGKLGNWEIGELGNSGAGKSGGDPVEERERASPDFPVSQFPSFPLLLAGALGAGSALLKFSAALPVLPFLALALWRTPGRRRAMLLAFAAGAMAPLAAMGVWLACGGAWDSYIAIQRGFVAPYARSLAGSPLRRAASLVWSTGYWVGQLWLPVGLAAFGALSRERWKQWGTRSAAAALLCGVAAVWVQNKYFSYHWQSALPFVALLAAAGSLQLVERLGLRSRAAVVAAVLPAVAWGLAGQWSYYSALPAYLAGGPREEWLAHFGRPGGGDYCFLADVQAARYVSACTRPGDPIFIWGFEPAVYLLSDRRPPTRFLFSLPVTSPLSPPSWRKEFLSTIRTRPPELFLVVRNDPVPWASGLADDSAAQLRSWPELSTWLAAHYREETRIEDFTIYRRVRENWPQAAKHVPSG